MIWHIAKKEFINNIYTVTFTIGFILCIFLIPYTVYTGVKAYESRVEKFQNASKETNEAWNKVQVYGQLRPTVMQPPTPLSIFCKGISEQVGNRVTITNNQKATFAQGINTMFENPFLNSFLRLDFVNILAIVLSLLGLFFSYNLFSSEKETGMLRLSLSNSLSRATFFTGKVTGLFLTLLPILVVCYLIVLVIIQISPMVQLSGNDYLRLAILFILSLVYFSFFVFLGSFISSRVKSSAASLIINLFAWSLLLFLIPSTMSYLGKNIVKTEDYTAVEVGMNQIEQEFWNEYKDIQKKVSNEGYSGNAWNVCAGWNYGPMMLCFTPDSVMMYERRCHELTAFTVLEYSGEKWRLQETYLENLYRQERAIKYLSCISPSEIFKYVAATLCKTDMKTHNDFMQQTDKYRDRFFKYFKDNNIFGSYSYFSPQPENTFPKDWNEADEMYKNWKNNANPESTFDLSSLGYQDTNNIPRFEYKEWNIAGGLQYQLYLLVTIVLLCILLYWFTYVSFIRYDVR